VIENSTTKRPLRSSTKFPNSVLGVCHVRQSLHRGALVVGCKVRVLTRDCRALVPYDLARLDAHSRIDGEQTLPHRFTETYPQHLHTEIGGRDWCNQTDRFLANLPHACELQWRQFPKGLHMCASASFRVTSRRISCSTSVESQIREGQNNESLIGKESKNENLYCL
jgi:hypothetical protein